MENLSPCFSLLYCGCHRCAIQAPVTRRALAYGLARQFFGCYLVPCKCSDSWVCDGLARYVAALYCQKTFGNNEYLYNVQEDLNQVIDYECKWGGIVLNDTTSALPNELDNIMGNSIFRCPIYHEMYTKKAFLVLRVLEKKLGKELMLQVINKLLSVCAHVSQQRSQPALWSNGVLLSTESFLKCVSSVTGHDLQSFAEQFVNKAGHPEFIINYSFNRKRHTIELEVKQDLSVKGAAKYIGSVAVTVQELDGSFTQTVQIDDVSTWHDIQCHSKARRQRKRKIPLWTGEEVDIDLACLDPDNPILWIRFDPELLTVGRCIVNQPDYQWQLQLKHEKDVIAQLMALAMLPRYPTTLTRTALIDIIKNEQCFYRIRCGACYALAEVSNKLLNIWTGAPTQISIFTSLFGSKSTPGIPRLNNFTNFQHYFLAKALVSSLTISKSGGVPTVLSTAPEGCHSTDVHEFFANLCKFNNNSQNKFSDDFYMAELLEAFGKSVVRNCAERTREALSEERNKLISKIVQELTHALNNENIRRSYNKVISAACLRGLICTREPGYLKDQPKSVSVNSDTFSEDYLTLWWSFIEQESYLPLKRVAIECIIDFLLSRQAVDFYDSTRSKLDSLCYDKFVDFLNSDASVGCQSYALYYLVRQLTSSVRNDENYGRIFKTKRCFDDLLKILGKYQFHDSTALSLSLSLMTVLFGSKMASFTADGFLLDDTNIDKSTNGWKTGSNYDLSTADFTVTPVTIL